MNLGTVKVYRDLPHTTVAYEGVETVLMTVEHSMLTITCVDPDGDRTWVHWPREQFTCYAYSAPVAERVEAKSVGFA